MSEQPSKELREGSLAPPTSKEEGRQANLPPFASLGLPTGP